MDGWVGGELILRAPFSVLAQIDWIRLCHRHVLVGIGGTLGNR